MDLRNNKKLVIIGIVSLLCVFLLVILLISNNSQQSDIEKQTAEIYSGAPRTTLSGDKSNDLYYLVTDVEHKKLQYALGDFFHNSLQQSDLQNTVFITNAEQSYELNQDIVLFTFTQDNTTYFTAKIIRPLSGEDVTRFVIENQNFDVELAKYKYVY